jgi:hypothetical protein
MNHHGHQRRAFTLVEVTVACVLTAFFMILLSTTWGLLMRPTADLIVWGQLFQEMDVAVVSLARDLGGSLPDYKDSSGLPGEKPQGLLLQGKATTDAEGDHLMLCYDGGASPDGTADWSVSTADTIIDYYKTADNCLVRRKTVGGVTTSFTVANDVASMSVGDAPSDSTSLQIVLTFSNVVKATHKTLTRQCTLITKKNP